MLLVYPYAEGMVIVSIFVVCDHTKAHFSIVMI